MRAEKRRERNIRNLSTLKYGFHVFCYCRCMTEEEKNNNSNKKDNTFIYRYIPSGIVREWADSSGNVSFVRRGERKAGKCSADDIFCEEYSVNGDADDPSDLDTFSHSGVSRMIGALQKEEPEFSLLTLSGAALLALSLYYKAPGAPRAGERGNNRTLENLKDMDSEMKFTLPYLMDLSMAVVDAPEDYAFVLGDHPLYITNRLFRGEEAGNGNPLYNRGLIMLIPLTPQRAVMLCDGESYWFHGKDGRFVLTPEDMRGINDYMKKRSDTVVIVSEEKYDSVYPGYESYSRDIVNDMNSTDGDRNTSEPPLLFISISPDADEDGESTIRRGVSRLLSADALKIVASGLDPDDEYVLKLRLETVLGEREKGKRTE